MSQTSIEKIRGFNRFYTKHLGLLNNKILRSEFSLVEARILFELYAKGVMTASGISRELDLDPSYLSRILSRFEKNGLITRERSKDDSRVQDIRLTEAGRDAFLRLQSISNAQIEGITSGLSETEMNCLLHSMGQIKRLLTGNADDADLITIRYHKPGDIGYLAYMHGRFYAREYGFDITFDSYVAGAMAKFIDGYNEERDRLWIVELNSIMMGSIAIVDLGGGTAQLRWFILEPQLHGRGIGKKLMHDAVEFCREKRYKKVILWTFDDLKAARALYEREGFTISETRSHRIWGQDITEEMWELSL